MAKDERSSTHPPLPPTTEDDRIDHLRLLRSRRVGPATYRRLLAEHGTAKAALAALPQIAEAAGVRGYDVCPLGVVQAELKAAQRFKARLLFASDPDYPNPLREVDDAPPMLWAAGDLSLLRKPMVALVGARNASSLGTRMARKLAEDLGKAGIAVVSGLARGVDTVAHTAALETGTIAVVAGGIDVCYPAQNADLARKIADQGVVLSDQPMGLQPQARHFVARNRIISGMTGATVVVEAAAKSGSLITARTALDQGRDVFAVPGHPFEARAAGCNMLIRDGAYLIRSAADVLDHLGTALLNPTPELPLGTETPTTQTTNPPVHSPKTALQHADILGRLDHTPIAEDQLIRSLGAPATEVSPMLLDLELEGKVVRDIGGRLARAN